MRTLIIDDEPTVADALAEAVRHQGYEAVVTNRGADAPAAIRNHRPDGVFLDLVMPGMGGVEVLHGSVPSGPVFPWCW